MEIIEYMVTNAQDIMFLCIGIGVLILSVNLSRALIQLVAILKKANRISDTVEKVMVKPLQLANQVNNFISRFV